MVMPTKTMTNAVGMLNRTVKRTTKNPFFGDKRQKKFSARGVPETLTRPRLFYGHERSSGIVI